MDFGDHGISATGTAPLTVGVCDLPYPGSAPHVYGCQCHSCIGYTFTTTWIVSDATKTGISDADVQRIARAVVDLLRSENHDPGDEG